MKWAEWLGISLSTFVIVALCGCSAFHDREQSYKTATQPAFNTIRLQTDPTNKDCWKQNSQSCLTIGTILLTKPEDNLSFQFARRNRNGNQESPYQVITCISPAAISNATNTSAGGTLGINRISLGASEATTTTGTVIVSLDQTSHYVATAAFYNCLAYAADMIDEKTAAANLKQIFDDALHLPATVKSN